MDRDYILDELLELFNHDPTAVLMRGTNSIAPNCPTSGVLRVTFWGCSTKHTDWGEKPEGWDALVQREKEQGDGTLGFYVVVDGNGNKFCLDKEDRCYRALVEKPRLSRVEELADVLAEQLGDSW